MLHILAWLQNKIDGLPINGNSIIIDDRTKLFLFEQTFLSMFSLTVATSCRNSKTKCGVSFDLRSRADWLHSAKRILRK